MVDVAKEQERFKIYRVGGKVRLSVIPQKEEKQTNREKGDGGGNQNAGSSRWGPSGGNSSGNSSGDTNGRNNNEWWSNDNWNTDSWQDDKRN